MRLIVSLLLFLLLTLLLSLLTNVVVSLLLVLGGEQRGRIRANPAIRDVTPSNRKLVSHTMSTLETGCSSVCGSWHEIPETSTKAYLQVCDVYFPLMSTSRPVYWTLAGGNSSPAPRDVSHDVTQGVFFRCCGRFFVESHDARRGTNCEMKT